MPNRKAARFVILGTAAGTLAGFSGYAMLPSRALPADPAALADALESQIPNRTVKADRLTAPVPTKLASAEGATYSLASVSPTTDFDRSADRIRDKVAALPPTEPPPAALPPKAEPRRAALPAPSMPAEKSKKLPPPAAAPAPGAFLDDAQIAGVKSRLRLTSDQAEYWPAVEIALRDVVRTQFRESRIKHHHGKASIDVNAPEVQNLIHAAMPLLIRLREDQKHEVRKLARVIGLDQVASQI